MASCPAFLARSFSCPSFKAVLGGFNAVFPRLQLANSLQDNDLKPFKGRQGNLAGFAFFRHFLGIFRIFSHFSLEVSGGFFWG